MEHDEKGDREECYMFWGSNWPSIANLVLHTKYKYKEKEEEIVGTGSACINRKNDC